MSGGHTEVRAALDEGLRSVVRDLESKLGAGDAAMILRFVDHDELGVAFEMLRDLLIENQTAVPTATVETLVELARLMDLDSREAEFRRSFARAPS